jgi:hypothetical protein
MVRDDCKKDVAISGAKAITIGQTSAIACESVM